MKKVKEMKKAITPKRQVALTMGLMSTALLSGCSVMGTDFNCNKVGGLNACVTLDQVNGMVDDGQLGKKSAPPRLMADGTVADNTTTTRQKGGVNPTGYANAIPNIGQPVRYGDAIQQITIFPYEDSAGNYHEASILYAVLSKSHWIGYPVSQVQSDNSEM